jgi:hypothetical protein
VKFIVLLLSFYILTLNVFPCTDGGEVSVTSQTEVSQGADLNHGDLYQDLCAPFCTCHCCHVHTLEFPLADAAPFYREISSQLFLHFDSLGEEAISILLDPPRV